MPETNIRAEAVVRRLESQRYRAVLAGNVDAFEELSHPELVYTHSSGSRDSLREYADKLREGTVRYQRLDHSVDRITILGDTALVNIQIDADVSVNGSLMTMKNSALVVWVNDGISWKFAAYQATPNLRP